MHDGKTFKVGTFIRENSHYVKVFQDGMQVSPEYSATFDVGFDFFQKFQDKIVNELSRIAQEDIRKGIYYKP
ncbi:MAG: hypothetical protein IPN92_00890 [Chromatiaceae bacterium]|nr:hypothetical protein [Chromatiaceae bacterium]